jgi:hypothetical protein
MLRWNARLGERSARHLSHLWNPKQRHDIKSDRI